MLTGEGVSDGSQYNKPGFVCYLNHTVLLFYFPIIYLILLSQGRSFEEWIRNWYGNFTGGKALYEATVLALIYWICIWTWIVGLTYISVSASNALYQLQCVFAVGFSVVFLREEMTDNRKLGCAIAGAGICAVVLPPFFMGDGSNKTVEDDDGSNPQNSPHAALKVRTMAATRRAARSSQLCLEISNSFSAGHAVHSRIRSTLGSI